LKFDFLHTGNYLLKFPFTFSLIILSFLLQLNTATAQNSRLIGLPVIYNYAPSEYGFHSQNWGGVQDHRGMIYFANSDGILEYDGVNWRLIRLPNGVTCRTLYLAEDNTVYVAGFNEIGYISLSPTGNAGYVSLKSRILGDKKEFLDVWSITGLNGKVYFSTNSEIFVWDGKNVSTFNSPRSISSLLSVNGKIVVAFSSSNPELFDGTKFVPFIKNNLLENVGRTIICPNPNGGLIIFTKDGSMFEIRNDLVTRIADGIPILKDGGGVYDAKLLSNGYFGLATTKAGVVIVDQNGDIVQILNEEAGLANNVVYSIFEDREHNLWITLEEGLARINLFSPISIFDRRFKLFGSLADVTIFNNSLFVSSTFGLFSLNLTTDVNSPIFRKHNLRLDESWNFFNYKNNLYITTSTGFYLVDDRTEIRLDDDYSFMAYSPSDSTDIILLASDNGVRVLRMSENGEKVLQAINVEGVSGEVRNITALGVNDYWLEVTPKTLLRVKFTNGYFNKPEILSYEQGASQFGDAIATINLNGNPIIMSNNGLLKYDTKKNLFTRLKSNLVIKPRDPFSSPLVCKFGIDSLILFLEGSIFSIHVFPDENRCEFSRIGRIKAFNVYNIYADKKFDEKSLWFATSTGLLKFDLSMRDPQDEKKTFIRSISSGDSLYFSGLSSGEDFLSLPPGSSVTLNFSALSFEDESSVLYQTYMEGLDTSWQIPSKNPFKEFSGLPPGKYKFKVRSILPSGITTQEGVFHLKIRNHWYANIYAYLLYFLIVLALVVLFIKSRTSLLVLERDSLEAIVNERTSKLRLLNDELNEKNQQLLTTNLQLEQLDKEKSNYLGIVAHDLKNPLSGVHGFAEIICDEYSNLTAEEITRFAQNIRISSVSMLDIINKLLSIDMMEQGKMDVVLQDFSLTNLIEEIVESNSHHMKRKGVKVVWETDTEVMYVHSDRNLFSQILDNLVSNAIKYSHSNSTVSIRCLKEDGNVTIEVEDHGVGIPADEMNLLFKKFSKLSSRPTAGESSTGLGLSIVFMLVKLLGGSINCKSEPGKGSIFSVVFPLINGI
jgi:signal transduction histidine kinase